VKTGKKIAFSLLPGLLLLGAGELATRIAGTEECSPISPQAGDWETMSGDPYLLWKLEPDTEFRTGRDVTRINSVGLRESLSPSKSKPSNEKRIMLTGDSSIYGWGVRDNETYAVRLEEELRHRLREPVEVVNLGVPGYSTEQTLRLLEQVGWSYSPDLLVVSNIFSDCNIDAFQDRQAMRLTMPPEGRMQTALRSSRLYCSVQMPWARYQAGLNQNPNRVLMPGIPTGPNAAVRLEKLNASIRLSRVPIPQYLENLDTLLAQATERGAKMLLAPLAQEWDVGIWNVPMPKPSPEHVLPWQPYREAQKEWAEKNGVAVISFPQAFARYSGNKQSLFVDNMHPSPVGTKVMAKEVAQHILEHPELIGSQQKQRRR
jgi:lysophospholipase L1-like esterase